MFFETRHQWFLVTVTSSIDIVKIGKHRMSDLETLEENRTIPRTRTLQGATILVDNNSTFSCQIKTRSDKGFGLKLGNSNGIPDEFQLVDGKNDVCYNVAVVWRKRSMLGVEIVD